MRLFSFFLGPCLWSHAPLVFGISRNAQPAAGGDVFLLHVLAPSLLSLSNFRACVALLLSGLCSTVPRATLSRGRLSRDVTNLVLRNPVLEEKMLPGRCGNPIFDD